MKFFLVAIVLIAQMNYFVHCKYNLLRLLNKYQQLTEDMADDSMMQLQNVQKEFSFTNCGSASDPLQFKSLSIKPQPLHIPGPLTISTDISLLKNLSSPVTVIKNCTSVKFSSFKMLFFQGCSQNSQTSWSILSHITVCR